MKIFSRLLKHGVTTSSAGKRAFPAETLKVIEATIADGETRHRAEVRLIVEHSLSLGAVLQRITSRQRAIELFSRYRIWDTEENSGVLVYINLADRKVEIIADRAVGRLIGKEAWHAVCRTMTRGFAQGEFHDSSVAAMVRLNALLETHFPASGTHVNQLSNKPIVL
ncbi:MAG: TPM domain-containing protein [Burkholderiaceae bacterium]|nr:TPM domain-containing protein [Burkholderiaceae bacterium]